MCIFPARMSASAFPGFMGAAFREVADGISEGWVAIQRMMMNERYVLFLLYGVLYRTDRTKHGLHTVLLPWKNRAAVRHGFPRGE
jgi:hypothetical protein